MKKLRLIRRIVLLILSISLFWNVDLTPGAEELTLYARGAVLMDADSGRVLYEKDGYTHMPNASTTKIMTCILAIESQRLEEEAVVSAYAATMPKVRLGVTAGDRFRVRDLLYSLMLESHNDAAVILAEHIGGSVEGFAAMMNDKAAELGCTDTYFITPNGLDAQDDHGVHGTTARDLALMMSYCLKNEEFLEITRTQSYQFTNVQGNKSYSCNNHNAFLTMMEGALSGKTGFTGNAGYCYVGALRQGERTFVVALLACGWPNNKSYKWSDTRKLMEYGLANYQYEDVWDQELELPKLLVEGARPARWELYQQVQVQPTVRPQSLKVLKRADEAVRVVPKLPRVLTAPVEAGSRVGTVSYFLGEQQIAVLPVILEEGAEAMEDSWNLKYVLREFFMSRPWSYW